MANRPRTTAKTAWTSDTSAGWRTLNVKSIVEEIIAQPGWQSGNAMGFLFIAQTNAAPFTLLIRSYDNTDHSYAPYLDIVFTPLTTLAVGNHASGQVADAFDGNLSQNDKELFRFRLTNTTGSDATIDQIVFPLSSVSGISSGDLSDLKIKEGITEIVTGGVASISSGTGTITFTGDWTVAAGQTKDYSLYGDVSNLQYADTLTIALGSANITVSGDASGSVSVSAVHTADYAATLANYGTGQLTDQLDGTPTQNDKNLFRFRLVNTTVSDLTVGQVVLQLSSVTGIADTDLSDLRINNGTIDVTTGGVASIAAGSGTITFGTDFTLPASATVDYTVIGDVANIVKNDTMTIALGPANVTLAAGIVGGSAPNNVTHTGDDAATLGNHASGQLTDQFDSAPAKDNVSLFRFQLVNTTAVDLTIDQVQFQLSAITGIVTSNLSDLRINNGTTDVVTGGSPNISGDNRHDHLHRRLHSAGKRHRQLHAYRRRHLPGRRRHGDHRTGYRECHVAGRQPRRHGPDQRHAHDELAAGQRQRR